MFPAPLRRGRGVISYYGETPAWIGLYEKWGKKGGCDALVFLVPLILTCHDSDASGGKVSHLESGVPQRFNPLLGSNHSGIFLERAHLFFAGA